jgi:prepilin-type N-terminal cleavage/methylation domain-containing protein
MSKISIRRQPWAQTQGRAAFTLVELLVVIAILGVLISLLTPAVTKAQRSARQVESMANMRQLHWRLTAWADEHESRLPGAYLSSDVVDPYIAARPWWRNIGDGPDGTAQSGIFEFRDGRPTRLYDRVVARRFPDRVSVTYAMNTFGTGTGSAQTSTLPLHKIVSPTEAVLLSLCSPLPWHNTSFGYGNGNGSDGWPSRPYDNRSLIGFADGHVRSVGPDPGRASGLDLPDDAWTLQGE